MQIAPLIVQVYTRKNHFINCIESLSKCRLADQTHLFIASDAPKTDADKEPVNEIRNYCLNINGFKKVELIISEKNLGATETGGNAMIRVFSEYDKLIYTEDDNVFSPNFLEFINEGLEYYKKNPNIFSICGYKHPFKIPRKYQYDVFSTTIVAAWGFGLWKEKYFAMDKYPKYFDVSPRQKRKMSISWQTLMFDAISNNKVYGDVFMVYYCLKNNMVNIFPVISLVQNHGFDGSGIHCGTSSKYSSQEICIENRKFKFIDDINIQPNIEKRVMDAVDFPFKNTFERFYLKILNKTKIIIIMILKTIHLWNFIKRKGKQNKSNENII